MGLIRAAPLPAGSGYISCDQKILFKVRNPFLRITMVFYHTRSNQFGHAAGAFIQRTKLVYPLFRTLLVMFSDPLPLIYQRKTKEELAWNSPGTGDRTLLFLAGGKKKPGLCFAFFPVGRHL